MYRILVIDDEESILNLIHAMLLKAFKDVEVFTSSQATKGLELAYEKKPHLIILDCILQDKSGLEVCGILKNDSRTSLIPILMISGDRRGKDELKVSFQQGAESYLYKPFTMETLISQVKLLLHLAEAQNRLISEKEALERDIIARNKELEQAKNMLQNQVKELENIIELQTKELVRADRLANLGVMAAGIAHEVNNPTTFIASNLQTFKMFWQYLEELFKSYATGLSEIDKEGKINYILAEMPSLISGMESGVSRISAIIKGMKSYASGGSTEKDNVVDIEETINSALQLVCNQIKHDITLVKEIEKNLPKVLGSETSLCQVFVNLILNATHAMKEYRGEGKLVIRASSDNNGMITICFIDNGPGIKQEHLQTLFNPFFTTRRDKGGTGLGLFISHGIIKGHNGSINVESTAGKGATFIVKLPIIDKDQTIAATVESDVNEPQKQETLEATFKQ
jgi:C4-dicarboxylate-specific signal transduction histidine kinase